MTISAIPARSTNVKAPSATYAIVRPTRRPGMCGRSPLRLEQNQWDHAGRRDVLPGVVLLLAVQASLIALDPDGRASASNLAWSLLPAIPAIWLVWSQLRSRRRADERQRIMQLEAMAVGFGAVIFLSFAGGLLDAAGIGSARQSLQVTFIVGTLAWVLALVIGARRQR